MQVPMKSAKETPPIALLVPYGPVKEQDLEFLMHALSKKGMRVLIAPEKTVPAAAWNRARQQYRGDLFLDEASVQAADRALAVTLCDLYASNLNFIFGLADARKRSAVVSLFRLRMGADEKTFRSRALKEAVHELGHTWGLSHCPNPCCVMHFSNSLQDTDAKETEWCEGCARKLRDFHWLRR